VGLESVGKLLIGAAVVLIVLGGLFLLLGRLGIDRMPGDLVFRRGNATFYFPIGLMILLSIVGTLVLNILFRR
jgi:multisubunit Na+/H+ antiporter MnhG subunit